jgi:hypothetical protein
MIFIGDLAFTGILSLKESYANNKQRFVEVIKHLENNLVFANLEIPLKSTEEHNQFKNILFGSSFEATGNLLQLLNISCVSLANNHIYDYKMSGLKSTINLLNQLNIYHTGAGWKPKHVAPVIFENQSKKIAFLAYVDNSTNPKTENFPELLINYFEPSRVKEEIGSVRKKADFVICSIHWGVDYSHYPTKKQRDIAKELIDAGADVIMGHHTHTIQPYERHGSGVIFYSLGGLTFGDYLVNNKLKALRKKTKTGLIAKLDGSNNFTPVITTELKGNYIKINESFDYFQWSRNKLRVSDLMIKYGLLKKMISIKENILDRIHEYFFGYYNNPWKRLFEIKNIFKIKKLF